MKKIHREAGRRGEESWKLSLSVFVALALLACGSRSTLDALDAVAAAQGGGGAGGSPSTSSATSSSGSGGSDPGCHALLLVQPVIAAPTPTPARAPEIGVFLPENELFLAFIEAPLHTPGLLRALRLQAFAAWPPDPITLVDLDADVLDYVTGPGPTGPVALLRHGAGDPSFLATTFLPQIEGLPLGAGNDRVLFATAIPDRYLAAQVTETPSYEVLGVGSYQPGSLPQSEDPLVCITSSVLGAAVPSGSGFLAAFVEPNPPEPACDVQAPLPGSIVSLMRYDAPPAPGSFLERIQGERLVGPEPVAHLHLAPASFGAWVVLQTDGSTSRVQPPVLAGPIDSNAQPFEPNTGLLPVSPSGVTSGPIAVAALGDDLAVAWVESIDPSAPTIIVQIVGPDGAFGPATSVPTNPAWLSGRMRMQASPDRRSLLLAWEAGLDDAHIGLARIDCVGGL